MLRFYREKVLDPDPAFVSWMFTPEMVVAIREACERFRPDIVQVETTEMAQYLPSVPAGPARALDLQDVASRWFGRVRRMGSSRQERALMSLELFKTRRYEARYARHAEVVFVSSTVDGTFYRKHTGVEPVDVPNGVDTRAFVPMPNVVEDAKTILFVGPLTYDANLDGMRWFAADVLPLILHADPAIKIELVGTPADVVFPPQVRMLGRVDDVRPHLARCPVSIVPVRIGTGTRYKILEALSMERAVVSTTVGAEGLGVVNGEQLMLADDPVEFARAVLRCLNEPALRKTLGAAGRAHVVPRFDWEPLVARVEESWARAVSGSGGA